MVKISIIPDNIEFLVEEAETILDAGLRHGLNLPHGCKNGDCGACKCKVVSGDVRLETYKHKVLSDDEIKQGYTLLCKAHPTTEVVLNIPHLANSFPVQILPAKVIKINKSGKVAIVTFKLPKTKAFNFFAGQYIDIIVGNKNRSYSIANANLQNSEIEIHVGYYASGVFSEYVWNELKENDVLRFKGPLGSFCLQDTQKPILLVCTGTGFAPIKAILGSLVLLESSRQVFLYWGNRETTDFYLLELLEIWKAKLQLRATLCVSREDIAPFKHGHVTKYLEQDFTDLSGYEVYACGNLQMIEDVYEMCTEKLGLDRAGFFSDAFTPSV